MCVSVFRMRSLRKTALLAILVSVVLVLALLHSWPTRAYTTVDVWQRPGPLVEKHLEERLTEPDHRLGNISFHVRDNVARYGSFFKPVNLFHFSNNRAQLKADFLPFICLQLVGTQWMCMWGWEWRSKPALCPTLIPTGVSSPAAHCLWGLWAGGNQEETSQRVQEFQEEVSSLFGASSLQHLHAYMLTLIGPIVVDKGSNQQALIQYKNSNSTIQ